MRWQKNSLMPVGTPLLCRVIGSLCGRRRRTPEAGKMEGGGVSEKGIEKHMSYSGGGRGIIYGYTKIYENVGFFS